MESKILIIAGVILIIFGLAISGKLGPLGRLPGDISISRPGFNFYFPLATSIIVSIAFSLIFWLFFRK
jgi:hypothetical protein